MKGSETEEIGLFMNEAQPTCDFNYGRDRVIIRILLQKNITYVTGNKAR